MAIKWTLMGLFIYLAMALYAASAAVRLTRARRLGGVLYGLGFIVAAAGWGYRWVEAGHVPLQNMFEVFLTLGMLMPPITLFCRRFLGVGGEAADAVIGCIILFPAGFIFHSEVQRLPPALQSWLFIPHVAAYMLSYAIMAKAAVPAVLQLAGSRPPAAPGLADYETATYRMVSLGFPLLTLGLVLGAVWGKQAWGDYWNWDPKELWSLVSWLVYLAYLHVRYQYGRKYPRLSAALVLAGLAAIVLTLLWVNLARIFGGGLHSYATG
ncbi:MAG: cytochrome c biogenesis protein CcsA [Planctomycetes bacterium]|nr:cytochrome c biogenesis protein CcsA [Planctomycetota bacterium]